MQDQTLLTTVVSTDPMYAYFDVDEPTLLRIRRAVSEGRIPVPQRGQVPVMMGLQGEEGFPHQGMINFVNNQVNPTTGSITWRGVFPNPEAADWLSAVVARHVRAHAFADWPAASRPSWSSIRRSSPIKV